MTSKNTTKVSKEAYAYTPGLKVKRAMTVSKIRRLPIQGKVLVEVGDKVAFNDIVAVTETPGDPELVKVADNLKIEPGDIQEYMKKKVGDQVIEGEVIAGYSALFGLVKKWVTSPMDGTIESISGETGQIILRGLPVPIEINAYIPGKVVEVLPGLGAVVETNAAFIQGIFGIGGEVHGKIKMAVESPDEELTPDHITLENKGQVLIGGSLATIETLRKGVEVGVSAIITGGIWERDLTMFTGEEIGVAITGQENVGIILIVTEGFGKMKMSERTFDLLRRYEGYMASVNGSTQIRAGVIRPEIIIPHGETLERESHEELEAGMIPGTPIRIIRQPYFGAIGKVVSLPVELRQVETMSSVRVVEVELEDGKVVTVPRANVEIIEE